MHDPLTPAEYQRMAQLWRILVSERRYALLGPLLVLVIDPWFVTLEVAQRWLLGKARQQSPLAGWFAGRCQGDN